MPRPGDPQTRLGVFKRVHIDGLWSLFAIMSKTSGDVREHARVVIREPMSNFSPPATP
jgi:hypothetical protein